MKRSFNLNKNYYDDKLNKYYVYSFFIVLLSIFIDRSFSPDYFAYIDYLKHDYIILEPTFRIIKYIVNGLGNENILFGIYAILGVGIKLYSFPKLTNLLFLTILFYLCSYWIYQDLIQIRAGVASAIFLFSLPYLIDRNAKKYFITIFIAILFHYSAIILIPVWFIDGKLNYKYIYLAMIPIAMVMYLINLDLIRLLSLIPVEYIQGKIETYSIVSNNLSSRGVLRASEYNPFVTWYILKCFIVEILWFNIKSIKKHNRYAVVLLKIFTISISMLWLLSGAPVIATRISEFLSIVQIILVPLLLYSDMPRFISLTVIYLYSFCWLFWNYSSFLIN